MIMRDTVVVGVLPRMPLQAFQDVLEAVQSPAASSASEIYAALVSESIEPSFGLACFSHESQFGKLGVCHDYDTRSIGNTRSSRIGVTTFVTVPIKGRYVKYLSWELGAKDFAKRLTDPNFDYARAGATTVGKIMPIFAPVTDGNSPDIYIDKVIALMQGWIDKGINEMPDVLNINGFTVGHGFKTYFENNGGVKFFGLPLTNEFTNPKSGLTEQIFERYVLEYDLKASPDWQIRGKDIGRLYLSAQNS